MRRPAPGFGTANVTRLYCDACFGPVAVCYKGRDGGDYCSEACRDRPVGLKVKTPDARKVKASAPQKVKTVPPVKVKAIGAAEVKTPPAPARVQKVKKPGRTDKRLCRRAAIRRILAEFTGTGREPTIAEVRGLLTPLGLDASVRTIWKDLNCCRTITRAITVADPGGVDFNLGR